MVGDQALNGELHCSCRSTFPPISAASIRGSDRTEDVPCLATLLQALCTLAPSRDQAISLRCGGSGGHEEQWRSLWRSRWISGEASGEDSGGPWRPPLTATVGMSPHPQRLPLVTLQPWRHGDVQANTNISISHSPAAQQHMEYTECRVLFDSENALTAENRSNSVPTHQPIVHHHHPPPCPPATF